MTKVDLYKDPENVDFIIEEIKSLPTLKEVKPIVDKYFPSWIIGTVKDYSIDYPTLKNNWIIVCNGLKISPLEIIIIDSDLTVDNEHKLIGLFCEILTRSGFCVRSKNHLTTCETCNLAIPTQHIYQMMKANGIKVPIFWTKKCSKC
jgi:hypothetical protein